MTIDLEDRLRNTLLRVADTVAEEPPRRAPARSRRRMLIAAGLAVAAVPLVVGAAGEGIRGWISRLPDGHVLVTGTVRGERYWLVRSELRADCGARFPGVDLLIESHNTGRERTGVVVSYGDSMDVPPAPATGEPSDGAPPTSGACGWDERAWLADPTRAAFSGQALDNDGLAGPMLVVGAVHPDVSAVRVDEPGAASRTVRTVPRTDRPDGPRYLVFPLADAENRTRLPVTLLDGRGQPVPGGSLTLYNQP